MFSTITMDPSPSIPMATAIPPRDIRLAETPVSFMRIMAVSAEKGSARATISDDLRLPRNSASVKRTSRAPKISAELTVRVALSTSSACS